jgi:hypothetical protein
MSGQEPGKRLRRVPGAHSRKANRRRDEGGKTWPRSRRKHMARLPDHGDARRIAAFLDRHPGWSAFWDKRDGVWRVAEDDPHSDLYAEDAHADRVIDYMAMHS